MELAEVVNPQYAFPVGFVFICAVFVFAFGFKLSNPPQFNQLVHSTDDRKTAGKKRKLKDKKSVQNNLSSSFGPEDGRKQKLENSSKISVGKASKQTKGTKDDGEKSQVTSSKQQLSKKKNVAQKENVNESVLSDVKSKTKDGKQSPEGKKIQPTKDSPAQSDVKAKSQEKRLLKEKNYNIQQVKNTRNNTSDGKSKSSKSTKPKVNEEKPIDFDDGEWEQAISRKEKKSKKKDEESLLAANAANSGTVPTPVSTATGLSTQLNNVSIDMPAAANNSSAHNLVRLGTSKDTSSADANSSVDNHPNTAVSVDAVAIGHLNGEAEKKETAAKASDSAVTPPPVSSEKSKSSKSKGKNKESAVPPVQKDTGSQENGTVSTGNLQQAVDEPSKSKKKKKQSNAADNKDGKPQTQPVESSKPQTIDIETPSGEGQDVVQESTSSAKIEPEAAVVFDELGDVWKEAKAPKKSKKKVRKDQ